MQGDARSLETITPSSMLEDAASHTPEDKADELTPIVESPLSVETRKKKEEGTMLDRK